MPRKWGAPAATWTASLIAGADSDRPEVPHMIPHPPPKDSGGDPDELPAATTEVRHLTCTCQRVAASPRSLCGLAVVREHPGWSRDVDPFTLSAAFPAQTPWCVVCHDLARTALDVGRCQRCPG